MTEILPLGQSPLLMQFLQVASCKLELGGFELENFFMACQNPTTSANDQSLCDCTIGAFFFLQPISNIKEVLSCFRWG